MTKPQNCPDKPPPKVSKDKSEPKSAEWLDKADKKGTFSQVGELYRPEWGKI